MDDDDYYPPESVLARVKTLVKYKEKGIKCVGCTLIGTYDLMNNKSSMSSDGPINLSEASMAYFKSFWEENILIIVVIRVSTNILHQKDYQSVDLPYSFVIIGINHKNKSIQED